MATCDLLTCYNDGGDGGWGKEKLLEKSGGRSDVFRKIGVSEDLENWLHPQSLT